MVTRSGSARRRRASQGRADSRHLTRRQTLPHSRLDGLDCHLCLAQQWQPTSHIAATMVGVAHLCYQVRPLADQVVQQIIHGVAPAIQATSSTRARQNISLFTSITNTSVNYKW